MGRRIIMAGHASADELEAQYRGVSDPVERSQRQIVWLLACGRSRAEVATLTGYSTRWISTVLARYNAAGPAGLSDRRSRQGPADGAPLAVF
jgi:Winged helix-turn helix